TRDKRSTISTRRAGLAEERAGAAQGARGTHEARGRALEADGRRGRSRGDRAKRESRNPARRTEQGPDADDLPDEQDPDGGSTGEGQGHVRAQRPGPARRRLVPSLTKTGFHYSNRGGFRE